MNDPIESNERAEAGSSPVPCSLVWEMINETTIKGFLALDPDTTLFLLHAEQDGQVRLSGAFIPDDEEGELWQVENAKAAAWQYMIDWIASKGRVVLSANTN